MTGYYPKMVENEIEDAAKVTEKAIVFKNAVQAIDSKNMEMLKIQLGFVQEAYEELQTGIEYHAKLKQIAALQLMVDAGFKFESYQIRGDSYIIKNGRVTFDDDSVPF